MAGVVEGWSDVADGSFGMKGGAARLGPQQLALPHAPLCRPQAGRREGLARRASAVAGGSSREGRAYVVDDSGRGRDEPRVIFRPSDSFGTGDFI